jgi:hypothetical protein
MFGAARDTDPHPILHPKELAELIPAEIYLPTIPKAFPLALIANGKISVGSKKVNM